MLVAALFFPSGDCKTGRSGASRAAWLRHDPVNVSEGGVQETVFLVLDPVNVVYCSINDGFLLKT